MAAREMGPSVFEPKRRPLRLIRMQGKVTTVKWLKRYAIGFMIALTFFTWANAYPDGVKNMKFGAVIVTAALWPIAVPIVLGGSAADLMREHNVLE